MAEEWGAVVLSVPDDIADAFESAQNGDARVAVERLANLSGVDVESLASADCRIGKVTRSDRYVAIDYDCSDWSRISQSFVSAATGIEYYFRGEDEYGTVELFSLGPSGERFGFAFDQGGDAWDQDGYEEKVMAKLDAWKSQVPAAVESAFPGLTDTSELLFDGP